MRIVIADDSMITREGLVRLVAENGVEVAGSAADASELLALVARERPDVAIVDIRMPPTFTDEGIAAAERIRSEWPATGVLVLSQHLEPGFALRLLEDYPTRTGYLLKDRVMDIAVLVDALRRIDDDETVVDPTIVARLMNRVRREDPLDALSAREREVLSLLAEGLTNEGIGKRLFIAPRTVETHVTRVLTKLDIRDDGSTHRRVSAVLTYLRHAG